MSDEGSQPDLADFTVWIIVAFYLGVAAVQLGDSLIIDEIEFPRLAEAVANTGRPVYYRGEQSPAHVGVFHPPAYAYTLGAWIALVGFSETAVRTFGVLVMMATALVAARTVEKLGLAGRWGKPVFLGLFLLHPFVIQSALLPDIDGTMLLLATMVTFLVATKTLDQVGWWRPAASLGLTFALALATKLTAALIIPTVFIGLASMKGFRWSARVVGVASLLGAGAFVGGWWLLATIAALPFEYPFQFLVQSGLKGGVADTGWSALLARLIPQQARRFWMGPLLPVGAIAGTAVLLARWKGHRDHRLAIMFAVWSVGTLVFYSLITGPPFGFPKYMVAAIPTMAILCVFAVDAAVDHARPRRAAPWLFIAATIGLGTLWGWRFTVSSDGGPYSSPGSPWLPLLVVVSLVVALAIVRPSRTRLGATFAVAFVVASLSYGTGTSVAQALDEASIRYFPGEVGFNATVERLKEVTVPGTLLLVPKDLGSAIYNRYHEQEQLFRDPDQLAAVLADSSVTHAVVRVDWDYSYKIFPEVEAIIEEHMDLMEVIGGFMIYARYHD